jgi:hypothetical protein
MAFSVEQLTKELDLDIPDNITGREKKELLDEIGNYLVTTMLDFIGEGKSPVTGKPFVKLTKNYATKEKGGDKTPNMDLNGDMLDALEFKVKKGVLEIGWFDDEQAPKAYGHTTGFEGHPWLEGEVKPRKLIPDEDEDFNSEILGGIDMIIEDFLDARKSED